MSVLAKLGLGVVLFTLLLGVVSFYKPSVESSQRSELLTPNLISGDKFAWKKVLSGFSQFQPKIDLDSLNAQAALAAKNKIDPNDISQAKLIGIFADTPQRAILQLPTIPNKPIANISTENGIVHVTKDDIILGGWQLVQVTTTRILWKHTQSDDEFEHYLFQPTAE